MNKRREELLAPIAEAEEAITETVIRSKRHINFWVSDADHLRLTEMGLKRRMKLQGLLELALNDWLAANNEPKLTPTQTRKLAK